MLSPRKKRPIGQSPPENHFKWLQQPWWVASGETFLARASSCPNRGVGKAGAVSMFKRYFFAQLSSSPFN